MKLTNNDKELNPSIRGTNRYISKIVRCPKHKSKISIGTCEKCPLYKGLIKGETDEFISCTFVRTKKE